MYVESRYSDSCLHETKIMNPPDTGFHSSGGQQFFYLNLTSSNVIKYSYVETRSLVAGSIQVVPLEWCSLRLPYPSGARQDQLNEIPSFTHSTVPTLLTSPKHIASYSYNDLSP